MLRAFSIDLPIPTFSLQKTQTHTETSVGFMIDYAIYFTFLN